MDSSGASGPLSLETALLRRFLDGDRGACRRVEKWAWEIVIFRGYGVSREEREDIVQETIAGLYQAVSRHGFILRTSLRALVRTIASARCIDRLRRSRPTAEIPDSAADPRPGPYDELLAGEERARLRWALQNLEPLCRDLIRLHFLEELPYAEIAARWGKAEATLRVRMFSCIRVIRRMLERWSGNRPGG